MPSGRVDLPGGGCAFGHRFSALPSLIRRRHLRQRRGQSRRIELFGHDDPVLFLFLILITANVDPAQIPEHVWLNLTMLYYPSLNYLITTNFDPAKALGPRVRDGAANDDLSLN